MLRYSKERLETESAVTDIYFKAQLELDRRKQLYERFRRKLTDEELASLSDEDIKVPLERYISIMSAGYFGGKPPIYKVKAFDEEKEKIIEELFDHETNDEQEIKEIEELIKHIVDYNDDASHFLYLVLDFLVKRACYEIYYKDETTEEITIARSDALETIAIWDYSLPKKLIGIYRIIQTTMANGEYQNMVELTTANGKKYYMDTPEKRKLFGTPDYDKTEYREKYGDEPLFKEQIDMQQPKLWDDDIPATAFEQEDGLAIFEPIVSLIEAYTRCIQNSRNIFKYNDEAKLVIKGYTPENPVTILNDKGEEIINPARVKEDEYRLKAQVAYLDGTEKSNGDMYWVEKNVNDSALQNHKKTLMDLICLCSFCPNMTDLGFTNAENNSAIEKKFFSLQQYIATFEGIFISGLKRRWRIILNKINKDKGKSYDFRDLTIQLQRNIPSDETSQTTNALKLRGLLSDETVINLLPQDLDAKNELEKMKTQNEENIEENLKNMSKMGQDTNNAQLNMQQDDNNQLKEKQGNKKMTGSQTIQKEVKQENIKQSDTIKNN